VNFLLLVFDTIVCRLYGTQTATHVVYNWNGIEDRNALVDFVNMFGETLNIGAGAETGPSGFVVYKMAGNPRIKLLITAQDVGRRNITVLIDYFELVNGNLETAYRTRFQNMSEIDYAGKQLSWTVPLNRQHGSHARIKTIYNESAMDVYIEARGMGLMFPFAGYDNIVDREVIESATNREF